MCSPSRAGHKPRYGPRAASAQSPRLAVGRVRKGSAGTEFTRSNVQHPEPGIVPGLAGGRLRPVDASCADHGSSCHHVRGLHARIMCVHGLMRFEFDEISMRTAHLSKRCKADTAPRARGSVRYSSASMEQHFELNNGHPP